MKSSTTISELSAENFLSFRKLNISLGPLNVLVGPNGAGKTNVLNIFKFLGDVARSDLLPAISEFGGFNRLAFRGVGGQYDTGKSPTIRIGLKGFVTEHASEAAPDEYQLSFWRRGGFSASEDRALIHRHEKIVLKRTQGRGRRITLSGSTIKVERTGDGRRRAPSPLSVQSASSGLATIRRLGEEYGASQINQLAEVFEQLRLFEIDVERVRRPSRSRTTSALRQDGGNLAPFLHYLEEEHSNAFEAICEDVRIILPGFRNFVFNRIGGAEDAIIVELREDRLGGTTPLGRVSFGTIRSIALLAMLHDPAPPRLTCLEEIDHGLHPHALDLLVERLREASERTQFILATHSPALVNRLEIRELIIVERDPVSGGSRVIRPDEHFVANLELETGYKLGELWFSGAIGGSN